jgi:NTE family protein
MAALMAIQMATGWDPDDAEVVVGTSAGSFVAALLRHEELTLDSLVHRGDSRDDVAERIANRLFVRKPGVAVGTWVRNGLLPGIRRPGVTLLLGSPAPFEASGLANWVRDRIGDESGDAWPVAPTVITAYDIRDRRRVAFGTTAAPPTGIADAVAASSSIPVMFRPYEIGGRAYVDGGVASGTHADLVLGSPRALDLVLVLAPMAAHEEREGALFHERMFDRVGRTALEDEVRLIEEQWPGVDIVVLRPGPQSLAAMRPNYMDPRAAVPSFVRTLIGMRRTLARPDVWPVLQRHLVRARRRARAN